MISTNLGSVLTNIQTGSTPTTSNPNYFIGDVLWFTPSDIGEEIYLSKTNRKLSKEALLSGKVNVFEKDMLLVTCIGDIGRVGILSQSSTSNQQITALKFIPEIDIIYAYYWFIANKSKLLALANQAVVPILNNERLRELKFYYPTLDFQHHIADILLQADRIRKLRRYSLQLSQSFLQSVYLGMFGDPVTNSHKYSIYRLEDICKKPNGIKAGPFGSSLKKDTYSKAGYRIYGQEQVIAEDLRIGDYFIDNETFLKFKQYEVHQDDILFSLVGTFGKVLLVPPNVTPGIINPRLLKITVDKNFIYPKFAIRLLMLPIIQNILFSLSHGGTMGILNASILKELAFPLPPLDEQFIFLRISDAHEKISLHLKESSRQSELLFQSLLHRAFTGQL